MDCPDESRTSLSSDKRRLRFAPIPGVEVADLVGVKVGVNVLVGENVFDLVGEGLGVGVDILVGVKV